MVYALTSRPTRHALLLVLKRYDNPHNRCCHVYTFYSRKQQSGEPVTTYIDEMTNLEAKLHINVNDMVATIKRSLLDPLKCI